MKYVGLDLGSVTCGVSASDTGFIAQTVKTIRFPSNDYDNALDQVEAYIREVKPEVIVLGWPILENGDRAEKALLCETFGQMLEKETGIPVKLQDERNTTKDSEEILIQADISRKKRKKVIDQMAAARILQYWLDANGPYADKGETHG